MKVKDFLEVRDDAWVKIITEAFSPTLKACGMATMVVLWDEEENQELDIPEVLLGFSVKCITPYESFRTDEIGFAIEV
jgi:hypothetical protein